MTELYEKVKKYVTDTYTKQGQIPLNQTRMIHFERTVYWLLQLKPDADEAFQIAAFAHDIERGFRKPEDNMYVGPEGYLDKKCMKYHQEKGAEIRGEFLEKHGASKEIIERVKHLISKHEVGGDDDQNLLKDADSLSFLENNVDFFIDKKLPVDGVEKVRPKIDWMYTRITSPKAKEIAKQWHQDAMKRLDELS